MSHQVFETVSTGSLRESVPRQRYVAVPVAVVACLSKIHCDVYIQPAGSWRKVLYRSSGSDRPIGAEEASDNRVFRHIYILAKDQHALDQAIRDALADTPQDPAMHLALTLEQHRESFQTAFQSLNVAPAVAASEEIARELLHVVRRDDFSIQKAVSLLDHDHCTFQHSCNVSIYASTLARNCGMNNEDIERLATGGLLHDIGKRQIPGFILRKPGKFDKRERELIRQHPTLGFRELTPLNKLNWGQLMMVYQHHEWVNGAGYPVGIRGETIHLWARICAIADVFDALTANRPYKSTDRVEQAVETMSGEQGHFDDHLFDIWKEIVRS